MKNDLSVSFVLLLLAASPVLYSQNSSPNCPDALSSTTDDCTVNLDEQSRREPTGIESGRSIEATTSAPSETASLSGRDRARPQEQPLPPDPPTEFQKFVAATTGEL